MVSVAVVVPVVVLIALSLPSALAAVSRCDYPRPLLERDEWRCLNGEWDLRIGNADLPIKINVPFPVEAPASGVGQVLEGREAVYRRVFDKTSEFPKCERLYLLHFEKVDREAVVLIDNVEYLTHVGGYDPFFVEIPASELNDEVEIIVKVRDDTGKSGGSFGKQSEEAFKVPGGIWYSSTSGIYDTVWIECVNDEFYVKDDDFRVSTINDTAVSVEFENSNAACFAQLEWQAELLHSKALNSRRVSISVPLIIHVPNATMWTPETPALYFARILVTKGDLKLDSFKTYFGIRTVGKTTIRNRSVHTLNDRPVYHLGMLDQGFWPEGVHTADSDRALKFDVELAKKLGFNVLRKHIKIESRRWYYWCDKLGILVWQDWPSRSASWLEEYLSDGESLRKFKEEGLKHVKSLRNHPSIVQWVPWNEGWGQPWRSNIIKTTIEEIAALDDSRLINDASGGLCFDRMYFRWFWGGCFGDYTDHHNYPNPEYETSAYMEKRIRPSTIRVIGEYGGIQLNPPQGKSFATDDEGDSLCVGYDAVKDGSMLATRYSLYASTLENLIETKGVVGAIYTQLSDTELECNGLVAYDRSAKMSDYDAQRIRDANERLVKHAERWFSQPEPPAGRVWKRSVVAAVLKAELRPMLGDALAGFIGDVVNFLAVNVVGYGA